METKEISDRIHFFSFDVNVETPFSTSKQFLFLSSVYYKLIVSHWTILHFRADYNPDYHDHRETTKTSIKTFFFSRVQNSVRVVRRKHDQAKEWPAGGLSIANRKCRLSVLSYCDLMDRRAYWKYLLSIHFVLFLSLDWFNQLSDKRRQDWS